jgi:hypothetical protein
VIIFTDDYKIRKDYPVFVIIGKDMNNMIKTLRENKFFVKTFDKFAKEFCIYDEPIKFTLENNVDLYRQIYDFTYANLDVPDDCIIIRTYGKLYCAIGIKYDHFNEMYMVDIEMQKIKGDVTYGTWFLMKNLRVSGKIPNLKDSAGIFFQQNKVYLAWRLNRIA